MADIALTNIVHGTEDGERIEVPAGTKISDTDLDADTIKALKEQDAIGPGPSEDDEKDRQALLDEIARLQTELAQQGTTAVPGEATADPEVLKANEEAVVNPKKDDNKATTPTTPKTTTPATPAK